MHKGTVRIIAGQWRGRKLKFPSLLGLRPTPDRVRETVFNWLSPFIHKAHCLDLFAGSGALGLEALSRGAEQVVFIDQSFKVTQYLKKYLEELRAEKQAIVYHFKVKPSLEIIPKQTFNLVFMDPPFRKHLIQPSCRWLEEKKMLANDAYIYIETESHLYPLPIPKNWKILKTKIAGQVRFSLIRRYSLDFT